MPIYEYQCPKCGYVEDVWKHQSEMHRNEKCQKCSYRMKRQITLAAFHLKGSGWYVTDYTKKTPESNDKD